MNLRQNLALVVNQLRLCPAHRVNRPIQHIQRRLVDNARVYDLFVSRSHFKLAFLLDHLVLLGRSLGAARGLREEDTGA